jgi:hypothetical protein
MKSPGLIVAAAAAGAVTALIVSLLSVKILVNKAIAPAGSDDEPILMAGGSMYISTPVGPDDFAPSGDDLQHQNTTRYVTKVEVRDANDVVYSYPFNGNNQAKIDVEFCKNCASDKETVTFVTGAQNNQGLIVHSDGSKMAHSIHLLPHLWVHRHHQKQIQSITVSGSTTTSPAKITCTDGDCLLTIHYCPMNANCSPN